jgi:hypothetical protein
MANLRILREVLYLESSSDLDDKLLEGVFQKGDEPNANRRVYPMEYLVRETNKLQEACKIRSLVGELDHPFYSGEGGESESAVIHAQNVSHLIPKLWVESKFIHGRLELLDTPTGLIFQEFKRKKVQIGVSSRSLGAAQEHANGFLYVDDSLQIITYDGVIGPSVAESKMNSIKVQREWKTFLEQTKNAVTGNMTEFNDEERARHLIRGILKEHNL